MFYEAATDTVGRVGPHAIKVSAVVTNGRVGNGRPTAWINLRLIKAAGH